MRISQEIKFETVRNSQPNVVEAPFMAKALGVAGVVPFVVSAGIACYSYDLSLASQALHSQVLLHVVIRCGFSP
jgi:hypothetical protein